MSKLCTDDSPRAFITLRRRLNDLKR